MSYWAQNFDPTNEFNILRLICGLFFIPHIYAKFFVPEALGLFCRGEVQAAGVLDVYRVRHRERAGDRIDFCDPAVLRRQRSALFISVWPRSPFTE